MPRGKRTLADYFAGRLPGQLRVQDVRLTTHQRRNGERIRSGVVQPYGPAPNLSQIQGPIGETGPTGPGYAATSSTSLTIATGSKTFVTQAGLAYSTGCRARASYDPSNWMEGEVTSYSGTSLIILVDLIAGSGTYAAWNINLAGERGEAGGDIASFLDLPDTPDSYAGHIGAIVVVNYDEDALEFASGGPGLTTTSAADILDGSSLLPDGCFEWDTLAPGLPDWWTVVGAGCSVRIQSADQVAGGRCIEFYDRTSADMTRIVADPRNVPDHPGYFPIDPTQVYALAGHVRRVNEANDGNRIVIHLGCYDAAFGVLSPTINLDVNPPTTAWVYYTLRIGPGEGTDWPAGTRYVRFSIRDLSTGNTAINRVDAVRARMASGDPTIEHDLLNGDMHPDTAAGAVERGALITGQIVDAVAKWAELVPGTTRQIPRWNSAGDLVAATPDIRVSELTPGVLPVVYRADNMVGDGGFNCVDSDGAMMFWALTGGANTTVQRKTGASSGVGEAYIEFSRTVADTACYLDSLVTIKAGKAGYIPVGSASYIVAISYLRSGAAAGNKLKVVLDCYAWDCTTATGSVTILDVVPGATLAVAWATIAIAGAGEDFDWPASTRYFRLRVVDYSTNAAAVNILATIAHLPLVFPHNLNVDVAGAGLSLNRPTGLAVNVDGSTIEISADALRVKAGANDQDALRTIGAAAAWAKPIATKDEDFEDITDWTTNNAGTATTEESPSGQLHLLAGDAAGADSAAQKYLDGVCTHLKEVTVEVKVKFDVLAAAFDGTAATLDAFGVCIWNGDNQLQVLFSTDSVWFCTASLVWTSQFAASFDNTSWYTFRIIYGTNHAYLFQSDDGAAWTYLGGCRAAFANTGNDGRIQIGVYNYPTAPATTEAHVEYIKLWPGSWPPMIAS